MRPELSTLNFVLVADAATGRRCRRWLAAHAANPFVRVGTWVDLIAQVQANWLIPESQAWTAALPELLKRQGDAFWNKSLEVAPEQVASTIENALLELVCCLPPNELAEIAGRFDGSPRVQQRIRDLLSLLDNPEQLRPEELQIIAAVLVDGDQKPLRNLRVYPVNTNLSLNAWQQALVERLAPEESDELGEQIAEFASDLTAPRAQQSSALKVVQHSLYESPAAATVPDDSMQFVGVRDPLEEVEVAVGMVQSMLQSDSQLELADIGICIPDYVYYAECCIELFGIAGLPLSGLSRQRPGRNLADELLFYLLFVCEKPSPVLAKCSVITNPLMPWSNDEAQRLVRQVLNGNRWLLNDLQLGKDAQWLWSLLDEGCAVNELGSVLTRLQSVVASNAVTKEMAMSFVDAASRLRQALHAGESDWHTLRNLVAPHSVQTALESGYSLEGLTVWQEESTPWRAVRHLIVLGFSNRYYPSVRPPSIIFNAADRETLNEAGIPVPQLQERVEQGRARFRQQLCNTADSATFLLPHYSVAGDVIAPSESLLDLAGLFGKAEEAEKIILDVDSAEDRKRIRWLATAEAGAAGALPDQMPGDLHLGQTLLGLRKNRKGEAKAESPSGLESLIVSPLAWLLRALDAEPVLWEPENFDVLLQGSAAHAVFEQLFQADQPLPSQSVIKERTPMLLDEALQSLSPFLMSGQWAVERHHLATSVTQAALGWRQMLKDIGGEIIAPEVWLEGHFGKAAIHGQADALVRIADGQLVVVDYKKSSSGKFETRMEKGYDLQATLYRTMLKTGGPKGRSAAEVAKKMEGLTLSGIVYFTLNDKSATADFNLESGHTTPNWHSVPGDVAKEGMKLLRQRLKEVEAGEVVAPKRTDLKALEKAGIKLYALENSPLAAEHVVEDEA